MRRSMRTAFTAFTVTILVAISAAAAALLPDHAAEATDLGIFQVDELFPAGTFEQYAFAPGCARCATAAIPMPHAGFSACGFVMGGWRGTSGSCGAR